MRRNRTHVSSDTCLLYQVWGDGVGAVGSEVGKPSSAVPPSRQQVCAVLSMTALRLQRALRPVPDRSLGRRQPVSVPPSPLCEPIAADVGSWEIRNGGQRRTAELFGQI